MTPAMTPPRDRLPTFYIPHGGGPCFFMEWTMGPADTWNRLKAWLEGFASSLSTRPEALLVISGHWEGEVPTVNTAEAPPLLFDYSGFPPSTAGSCSSTISARSSAVRWSGPRAWRAVWF